MATAEQRSRRRAQRATAARVKASRAKGGHYERILPREMSARVMEARSQYAIAVLEGREPSPPLNSPEGRNLASLASFASRGKADPRFEQAFSQYWYHKKEEPSEEDEEYYEDYDEEEDEE